AVTWTEITDLTNVVTSRLAIVGEIALALASAGVFYRSADGGVTFTAVAFDTDALGAVGDFVIRDGDILVATTKGLARSVDGGVSFVLEVEASSTFTDPLFNETPRIAETSDRIMLSADELHLSTDGGNTWGEAPKLIDATPFAVAATRDYLFASTLDGKLHASSGSSSWFEIDSQGYMMRDFASNKDTHYFLLRASGPDSVAYFADGEVVSLKDGDNEFGYVERPADNYTTTFGELHVHDGVLLLGSESISGTNGAPTPYGRGLYRSTDGGAHWEAANEGIASVGVDPYSYEKVYPAIVELHSFGDQLFVSLGDGTVMRSSDAGATWSDATTGLDGFDPQAPNGTDLFGSTGSTLLSASTQASLLFGFDAESGSWHSVPGVGLPAHFHLSAIMGHGGVFFASVRSAEDEVGGVYFSLDGGTSWQNLGLGYSMRTIGLKDDALFAGTDGDGLWSLDLGPCESK
ncbi:MAG: exo-alpha-sialidase, partial [Polyangiaceae bacterium]|nr:exo-alpha-sialidase [Polyangiaceae bacterium]